MEQKSIGKTVYEVREIKTTSSKEKNKFYHPSDDDMQVRFEQIQASSKSIYKVQGLSPHISLEPYSITNSLIWHQILPSQVLSIPQIPCTENLPLIGGTIFDHIENYENGVQMGFAENNIIRSPPVSVKTGLVFRQMIEEFEYEVQNDRGRATVRDEAERVGYG